MEFSTVESLFFLKFQFQRPYWLPCATMSGNIGCLVEYPGIFVPFCVCLIAEFECKFQFCFAHSEICSSTACLVTEAHVSLRAITSV